MSADAGANGGDDFFAASQSPPPRSAAASSGAPRPKLFLQDDEDEELLADDDEPMELIRAAEDAEGVSKKRKADDEAGPSRVGSSSAPQAEAGPSRGRSTSSPVASAAPTWTRRYIGSFIISAWSLSKGTSYIQQGDAVAITRQKPKAAAPPAPAKGTAAKAGKGAKGGKQTKLSFGKAAPAPPPKAPKKMKEDYIVRFNNMRGFEVGRVTSDIGMWMSTLLDHDMATFDGTVVDCPPSLTVGCDVLLEIKAYLCVSAFPVINTFTASVAEDPGFSPWGKETAETQAERTLRARKVALIKLFRACTLSPSLTNRLMKRVDASDALEEDAEPAAAGPANGSAAAKTSVATQQKAASGSKPAGSQKADAIIVSDDDVGAKPTGSAADARKRSVSPSKSDSGLSTAEEVNDGTELEEDQLGAVYKAAQRADHDLPEVEPSETFALELKPYQKKALGWLISMEAKQSGGARELSLHPLWEEYTFPIDESDAMAASELVEAGEAFSKFYFNPYTGHLSLTFQRASRGARGGILADEMGLGKTIQMAALIASNTGEEDSESEPEEIEEDEDDEPVRKRAFRQISLAQSFAATRNPSSPDSERQRLKTALRAAVKHHKVTLVIVPMSLLGQWRDELLRAIPGAEVMLYYAETKGDLMARLEGGSVDVVITSFGTLTTEHKRYTDAGGAAAQRNLTNSAPLFSVMWARVIVDEAHTIRNRVTRASKACTELLAARRWALTGTPIVNRLSDLYSLLRFLRVEPWGDYSFFNTFISKPFANGSPKGMQVVQVVLESLLLRRTKSMKDNDGKAIVELPEKDTIVKRLAFSPLEREIYRLTYERAHLQYAKLRANGTIGKNFSFIFAVLMRLRQAVCHPLLVLKKPNKKDVQEDVEEEAVELDEEGEVESELKRLVSEYQRGLDLEDGDDGVEAADVDELTDLLEKQHDSFEECPFCLEEKTEVCFMPCRHAGCRTCIMAHMELCEGKDERPRCPTCSQTFAMKDLVSAVRTRPRQNRLVEDGEDDEAPAEDAHSQPSLIFRKTDFRSSTKLEALIDDLNELRFAEPGFKGVIFSQFTAFLDLLEAVLRRNHYAYVRLDGTTSQKDRERVVKEFTKAPKSMLILVSLRAGGVGLNLTAAHHVWLLDYWWAAAPESQAIDRIHRLGQERRVTVHRYIIDNTIEDRILAIQARKTAMIGAALAGTGSGDKSEALQNLELLFGSS